MQDSDYFATLEPAKMLHVMIRDAIANGNCKKKNYEIFNSEKRNEQITEEEKIDEIIEVIMMAEPQEPLRILQRLGFIKFMIPRCFYSMKLMDKRTYYAIIDNFNKCDERDPAFRLNLFFFPFDPQISRETLMAANLNPDTVDWMMNIIDNYEEFKMLRSEVKLKRFITKWGLEFYYYMDEYADMILKVTGLKKEYGRYTSRSYVDRWVSKGHPLFLEDLAVTDEELLEEGNIAPGDLGEVKRFLLEHCYKRPQDNNRGMLLKTAGKFGFLDRLKYKTK